ncbi:MAG TPA: Sec-independent protein translocase subunit TatA [Pseudonocardiaceae bacterium]|nr:Sec-independent protein translocase subunit TatA [Pseudonocardiaceae bacterium]
MGELSPWHWIIVLLIFAVLFGSKKMPDAARGLGRSLRIFKAEMSGGQQDGTTPPTAPAEAEATAAAEAPVEDSVPAPVEDAVPPTVQPLISVPEPAEPAVER